MTNESFAAHLGIAVRTVAYWRDRAEMVPRPAMQEILDTALARAPETVRANFRLISASSSQAKALRAEGSDRADELTNLTTWLTSTNTSDETIEHIERSSMDLAAEHTQVPARRLLTDVLEVHDSLDNLLRSGRQRLKQTCDLLRIDGQLLAHASVLAGDIGQDKRAAAYGQAAVLYLKESEASQAPAWYALAKTARWQGSYAKAADLALRGFEYGPVAPMSVQLACYEANSAALLGDRQRARDALFRAEQIAQALPDQQVITSPWAFPADRRAIFRLSILLRTGDADGALAAAADAEHGWAAGDPRIPATWAQIRIGAAIAQLAKDSLDGAVEQVEPMLTLAPEYRIATVTGWLTDLDGRLAQRRFALSPTASDLRQRIRDFATAALPSQTSEVAG